MSKIILYHKAELKQALKLALPIIGGQLGVIMMNLIDLLMVGKLGEESVAAVTHANNVFFFIYFLGMGLLFAIAPRVAIFVGEGRASKSLLTLRAGIIISVVSFALLGLITYLITLNLHFTNSREPGVVETAKPFLHLLNLSALPMLIFFSYKQFLDGLSKTLPGMIITLLAVSLNVLLNWVFIYGNLGIQPMGVVGAGWATLISRIAMALGLYVYATKSKQVLALRAEQRFTKAEKREEFFGTLEMAWPIGLQFFAEVACFTIAGIIAGSLGKESQAAHGVALQLAAFTYMFVNGLSAAGSILVGNAYGEKRRAEILRVAKTIFFMVFTIELVFASGFIVFSDTLAGFFLDKPAVAEIASTLLVMSALFQLSDGIQVASISLLRGIEDVKIPSTVALICYWAVSVPLGWFLAFYTNMGIKGIWVGFIVGLSLVAILMYIRFKKVVKKVPDEGV